VYMYKRKEKRKKRASKGVSQRLADETDNNNDEGRGSILLLFSTPDDMMKEKLNAVRCLVVINKHKENNKQQHSTRGVKRKLSWLYNTDKRRWGGLQGLLFFFLLAQREREKQQTDNIRQYNGALYQGMGAVIIVPTIITQRQFPNSCPVLSTFVSFQISSQFDEITPKTIAANFPLFSL